MPSTKFLKRLLEKAANLRLAASEVSEPGRAMPSVPSWAFDSRFPELSSLNILLNKFAILSTAGCITSGKKVAKRKSLLGSPLHNDDVAMGWSDLCPYRSRHNHKCRPGLLHSRAYKMCIWLHFGLLAICFQASEQRFVKQSVSIIETKKKHLICIVSAGLSHWGIWCSIIHEFLSLSWAELDYDSPEVEAWLDLEVAEVYPGYQDAGYHEWSSHKDRMEEDTGRERDE